MQAAIADILTKREAKKRTDRLDQITIDRERRLGANADANTALATENAASLRAQREASAAFDAERLKDAVSTRLGKQLRPGEIGSDSQVKDAPDMFHDQQTLATKQTPALAFTPPGDPMKMAAIANPAQQATGKKAFNGTVAQQDREALMSNADVPEAVRQMVQAGGTPTAAMFKDPEDEMVDVTRVNPKTGKVEVVGRAKKGSHFVNEPQPPNQLHIDLGRPGGNSALDVAARQYIQTGRMPTNLGRGGDGTAQVLGRVAQMLAPGGEFEGVNPQENQLLFGADQGSMNALQKNIDSVSAFKNTARKNIATLRQKMQTLPDTGMSLLNRPVRELLSLTGDTHVTGFRTALGAVAPEIARIINTANLSGVTTVSAQQHIDQLLSGDYTLGQLEEAIQVFEQDMNNRESSYATQRDTIQGRIHGRGQGGQQAPAATPTEDPAARARALIEAARKPKP